MASRKPPTVGGSWLFGAARDLRRGQLVTYGRALGEHGGDLVRFRVGPPGVGIEFDTVFAPRRLGRFSPPMATFAGHDLLALLLAARDPESDGTLDDSAVRDQALTFLIAGHETTGTTLAFAPHVLGRHESAQDRVRDEVRLVVGERPVADTDIDHPQYTTQGDQRGPAPLPIRSQSSATPISAGASTATRFRQGDRGCQRLGHTSQP